MTGKKLPGEDIWWTREQVTQWHEREVSRSQVSPVDACLFVAITAILFVIVPVAVVLIAWR